MFEILQQALRNAPQKSQASQMALRSSARYEAILGTMNDLTGQSIRDPALTQWRLGDIHSAMLNVSNPYPKHPPIPGNYVDMNQRNIDRKMIRSFKEGKLDLNAALHWVKELSQRPAMRDQIKPNEEMALAQGLMEAERAGPAKSA